MRALRQRRDGEQETPTLRGADVASKTPQDAVLEAQGGAGGGVPAGEVERKPGRQAHRVAPGRIEVRPDRGSWACEYVSAANNGPLAIGSDPWWAAAKVCGFVLARMEQAREAA